MLAGYDHLLAAAARLRWDAEAIDLRDDARRAGHLSAGDRATLTALVTGFCLAEHAVADELAPYARAAARVDADPAARECFVVQARDEARHARFFDRVAAEVLGSEPALAQRSAAPALKELFAHELPAASRALAADTTRMAEAVGLYHLVLEGIVFAVGQAALLELAAARGLAGIADGVGRVQADERWHVGLGVLALQRLGAPLDVTTAARRALAAWGPRVATPERVAHVLAAHRRRLAIAAPGATRSRPEATRPEALRRARG